MEFRVPANGPNSQPPGWGECSRTCPLSAIKEMSQLPAEDNRKEPSCKRCLPGVHPLYSRTPGTESKPSPYQELSGLSPQRTLSLQTQLPTHDKTISSCACQVPINQKCLAAPQGDRSSRGRGDPQALAMPPDSNHAPRPMPSWGVGMGHTGPKY